MGCNRLRWSGIDCNELIGIGIYWILSGHKTNPYLGPENGHKLFLKWPEINANQNDKKCPGSLGRFFRDG